MSQWFEQWLGAGGHMSSPMEVEGTEEWEELELPSAAVQYALGDNDESPRATVAILGNEARQLGARARAFSASDLPQGWVREPGGREQACSGFASPPRRLAGVGMGW